MSKFTSLLGKGYFPSQLPPCFTTRSLAKKATYILRGVDAAIPGLDREHPYKSGPTLERYSVARSNRSRRPVAIPNPIAQIRLSELIATSWPQLNKFFNKSKISLSKPRFKAKQSRAISITAHSNLHEERLRHSTAAQYVLIADISQFFPSLYTHSISWALHSKKSAKARRRDKSLLGNKFDSAVQMTQNQQTLGIPIGPDTSHVISEVLGTAMDMRIQNALNGTLKGYRHVDDFVLFFESLSDAERGLSELEACADEFELKLNPLKTRIVAVSELVEEIWTHELLEYKFSSSIDVERRQLAHYFERAFSLSNELKDEAIIRFAIRQLATHVVKRPNWDLLQMLLLKCASGFPGAIQDIALVLFTYSHIGYKVDKKLLGASIGFLLRNHLPLGHHSEVAWTLWLALHFEVKVTLGNQIDLVYSKGSPTLILACALSEKKLLAPLIDKRKLEFLGRSEQLYDSMWLAAYELGRAQVIDGGNLYIRSDPLFALLLHQKVQFFDPFALPEPLFQKRRGLQDYAFDSNDDIDDRFRYSPISDTYSNSSLDSDDSEDDDDPDLEQLLKEIS